MGLGTGPSPQKSISSSKVGSVKVPGFAASSIFEQIESGLTTSSSQDRLAQVKKIGAIFAFDIKNNEGKSQAWYIDLKVIFFLFFFSFKI